MNMRIALDGQVSPEGSFELGVLAEELGREDLHVTKEEGPVPNGQKDAALTVALVVAGLAGLVRVHSAKLILPGFQAAC